MLTRVSTFMLLFLFLATTAAQAAELELVKMKFADEVAPGKRVRVSILIANDGGSPAAGVQARIHSGGQNWGTLTRRQTLQPGTRVWLEGEVVVPEGQVPDGDPEVALGEFMLPDLVVESVKLPKLINAGESTEAVVFIRNVGRGDAGGPSVHLVVNGRVVGSKRSLSVLRPGANEGLPVQWVPDRDGAQTLAAQVDRGRLISEADEDNNKLEMDVEVGERRKPELTLRGFELSGEPRLGSAVEVHVSVENEGNLPMFRLPVRLLVDGEQAAEVSRHRALKPGKSTIVDLNWTPHQAGPQELTVLVGDGSPSGTNSKSQSLEVLPRAAHDLKVLSLDIPEDPVAGNDYEIVVHLLNEGEIGAFAARADLMVDGQQISSGRATDGIEAGAEMSILLDWTPGRPGRVNIAVVVESRGAVQEYDLEDNRMEADRVVIPSKSRKNTNPQF